MERGLETYFGVVIILNDEMHKMLKNKDQARQMKTEKRDIQVAETVGTFM